MLVLVLLGACGKSGPPESRPQPAPGESVEMQPEAAVQWLRADDSRVLVDLREPEVFAEGHAEGAVNLQQDYEQFRIRALRFFGAKRPLLLAGEDADETAALARSMAGSFADLRHLAAPVASLREAGLAWTKQLRIGAAAAHERATRGEALLIDARTAEEYAAGHPAGAIFVYPDDFAKQLGFLRPDARYVVLCEAGWRSSFLVSWMRRHGFPQASNLMGGMKEWRAEGLAVERGSEQRAFKE